MRRVSEDLTLWWWLQDKKNVLELKTPRAKKPHYFILMPNKEALDYWVRAINTVIEQSNVRMLRRENF